MTVRLYGSGSSTPINNNSGREPIGYGTTGGFANIITASGTIHTDGGIVTMGVTTADWYGFELRFGRSNNTQARFGLKLSFDNGVTWEDPIYLAPGATTGTGSSMKLLRKVPAGSTIKAKCQASQASASIRFVIDGLKASAANAQPGYDHMKNLLAFNLATTQTSSLVLTPVSAYDTGWVTFLDPLDHNYGAFVGFAADDGNPIATSQEVTFRIGIGTGTPTGIYRWIVWVNNTSPRLSVGFGTLTENTIPIGSKLSVEVVAAALGAGADHYLANVMGFYNT